MLRYFTSEKEIADVVFALTQLVEHLSDAERQGGFELAASLLKRVGRSPRDHETPAERVAVVTMALPKHDFDVAIGKSTNGNCRVTVTGLPRYAGFSLSCTLPPRKLVAELDPDPANRVTWRARELFAAIRQDQRCKGDYRSSSCERVEGAPQPGPLREARNPAREER
jgi:hypothetical protein